MSVPPTIAVPPASVAGSHRDNIAEFTEQTKHDFEKWIQQPDHTNATKFHEQKVSQYRDWILNPKEKVVGIDGMCRSRTQHCAVGWLK